MIDNKVEPQQEKPIMMILVGVPCSGKTYFAKEFVKQNPGWIRINRDDLRLMCGNYWVPSREPLIEEMERHLVQEALAHNYNVIIDSTNLNPKTRKIWDTIADYFKCEVKVKEFFVSYEEAVKRDKNREIQVGEDTIRMFFRKYYPDQLKLELNEL